MSSYANQKFYHIKKQYEEGDIFLMLKWEDCVNAGKELSGTAFNLYLYLAKNNDGYNFYFSPAHFCEMYGVSDRTYRNARDKLFEKGYLKEGDNNNVYFDTKGGMAETKEGVKERLREVYERLNAMNEEYGLKILKEMKERKLSLIEEDSLYIIKAKEVISFGEDLINELSRSEFEGLL